MLAILWKLSCTCNIPGVCKHTQKEHVAPLVMNSYGFCDPMMWDFELPLYFFLHTISTLEVVKIVRCSWSVNILRVLSNPSLWDQQGGIGWHVWIFFSFAPSNGVACLCSTRVYNSPPDSADLQHGWNDFDLPGCCSKLHNLQCSCNLAQQQYGENENAKLKKHTKK